MQVGVDPAKVGQKLPDRAAALPNLNGALFMNHPVSNAATVSGRCGNESVTGGCVDVPDWMTCTEVAAPAPSPLPAQSVPEAALPMSSGLQQPQSVPQQIDRSSARMGVSDSQKSVIPQQGGAPQQHMGAPTAIESPIGSEVHRAQDSAAATSKTIGTPEPHSVHEKLAAAERRAAAAEAYVQEFESAQHRMAQWAEMAEAAAATQAQKLAAAEIRAHEAEIKLVAAERCALDAESLIVDVKFDAQQRIGSAHAHVAEKLAAAEQRAVMAEENTAQTVVQMNQAAQLHANATQEGIISDIKFDAQQRIACAHAHVAEQLAAAEQRAVMAEEGMGQMMVQMNQSAEQIAAAEHRAAVAEANMAQMMTQMDRTAQVHADATHVQELLRTADSQVQESGCVAQNLYAMVTELEQQLTVQQSEAGVTIHHLEQQLMQAQRELAAVLPVLEGSSLALSLAHRSIGRDVTVGSQMIYIETGELVKVVEVHVDDPHDIYYTVTMADGREKQTTRSKLTAVHPPGEQSPPFVPWVEVSPREQTESSVPADSALPEELEPPPAEDTTKQSQSARRQKLLLEQKVRKAATENTAMSEEASSNAEDIIERAAEVEAQKGAVARQAAADDIARRVAAAAERRSPSLCSRQLEDDAQHQPDTVTVVSSQATSGSISVEISPTIPAQYQTKNVGALQSEGDMFGAENSGKQSTDTSMASLTTSESKEGD